MPNKHCLIGFRCPKCMSEEPFRIAVFCNMRIYDDGTKSFEDIEWEDVSDCECMLCGHKEKVKDFWISTQEINKVRQARFQDLALLIGQMTTEDGRHALERRMKQ